MKKSLNTLYVTTQGARLNKEGEAVAGARAGVGQRAAEQFERATGRLLKQL